MRNGIKCDGIFIFLSLQVKFNVTQGERTKGTQIGRSVLIECEGLGCVNEDVVAPDDIKDRVDSTV